MALDEMGKVPAVIHKLLGLVVYDICCYIV